MPRRTFGAALVLALAAASCGGDDEGADDAGLADDALDAGDAVSTNDDRRAMLADERDEVMVTVDPAERCDLGFNTAEFNQTAPLVEQLNGHPHTPSPRGSSPEADFTVRQWAEVFVDPELGPSVEQVTAGIESDPDMESIILGGVIADTLDPDSWVPLTDPEACAELADELQRARDAAARHPTAADALAAGYTAGSVYVPGQGAHFLELDLIDGNFDPDHPEMLMYDGLDPASELMGVAYLLIDPEGVPDDEGFTGPSDRWRSHDESCVDDNGIAIAPTECEAGRGTLHTGIDAWVVHAWVVPGCESPWGVFSGANPRLPSLQPGTPIASGCNTGRTVHDPLALDDPGEGPSIE